MFLTRSLKASVNSEREEINVTAASHCVSLISDAGNRNGRMKTSALKSDFILAVLFPISVERGRRKK